VVESISAHRSAPWPLGDLGLPGRAERPRAAVLGLARSGLGAARLLLDRACEVVLLDLKHPEGSDSGLEALVSRGARLRIGPHDPAWLTEIDLLVKSPGIPATVPFVGEARARGIPVVGELELASLAARGPIIAITGTNGKSTTTAWTGDILRGAGGRALTVGNIGRAFSEGVMEDPEAVFVTEVSSFQLEDVRLFRPHVGCLLNLTPDHLDRHGSMEAYFELKLRLFARQGSGDFAVFGPDEDLASRARPRLHSAWARFAREDLGGEGAFLRDGVLWLRRQGREERLCERAALSLPGPHNLENALAAAASAAPLGVDAGDIARSLTSFGGLAHRLEPVGEVRGVRFVNDSKATNTDSLAVALRSFADPVVLIAGGRGKEQDFRPLRALVSERTSQLILIGEAAGILERDWSGVPALRASSLEEAVEAGFNRAHPGQVVLLSPACASFDMFRDYEDRGDRFRELVRRLAVREAARGGAVQRQEEERGGHA
jgi:UDP-N-acetylmuramoylalanine--D-glutamate ligase